MSGVRASLVYSSLGSWATVGFQLATTVVVARILTPEETGIFAVAAVFASLASTFRDFGVGEYLIQEKKIDDQVMRAALTVNISISWLMALLLFVAAPAAATFYATPGIADVMRIQALNFLLIPFGAVTIAWFRREMVFKPILVITVVANAVSFVVAVGLALTGAGYMALAWSSLAGVAATVAGAAIARPRHLPRLPGLAGVRRVVEFGRYASGIYIFGQLGKGAPEMVIGRALDMASVGIFSRAAGLAEIFNRLVLRAIMNVSLPYFAASARDEGTPVRGLLLSMSYLTAVGWTALGFLAIGAFSAIRLLYGAQWTEAVVLAQILCAAAAVELLYCTSKEAMLAVGKAKTSQNLQIVTELLRVAGVLAVLPFGLMGACWGLLAAAVAGGLASHLVLHRTIGLRAAQVISAVSPSLVLAAVALAPMLALTLWQPIGEHNYVRMGAAGAVLTTLAWIGALRALRHPLWDELLRMLVSSRRKLGLS